MKFIKKYFELSWKAAVWIIEFLVKILTGGFWR